MGYGTLSSILRSTQLIMEKFQTTKNAPLDASQILPSHQGAYSHPFQ